MPVAPRTVLSLAYAFPAIGSYTNARKDRFWAKDSVDVPVAVVDEGDCPVVGRMVRPHCGRFGAVEVEFRVVDGALMRKVFGHAPASLQDRQRMPYLRYDYPSPPACAIFTASGDLRPFPAVDTNDVEDVSRFVKVRDFGQNALARDACRRFAEGLRIVGGEVWRPTSAPAWAVVDLSRDPDNDLDGVGERLSIVPVVVDLDFRDVEARTFCSEASAPLALVDHRVPVDSVIASLAGLRDRCEVETVAAEFDPVPSEWNPDLGGVNAYLVGVSLLKAAEHKQTTWAALSPRLRADISATVAEASEGIGRPDATLTPEPLRRLASLEGRDWPSRCASRVVSVHDAARGIASEFSLEEEALGLAF